MRLPADHPTKTRPKGKGSRVDSNSDVLFQLKKLQAEATATYADLLRSGKQHDPETKALGRTIADRRNEINRLTDVRKRHAAAAEANKSHVNAG